MSVKNFRSIIAPGRTFYITHLRKRFFEIRSQCLWREAARFMLDYHPVPEPQTCDVCAYAIEQALDSRYEHARVRVATALMLDDLLELERDETVRLSSIAVNATGVAPGPVHPLDPRHWFWAMSTSQTSGFH